MNSTPSSVLFLKIKSPLEFDSSLTTLSFWKIALGNAVGLILLNSLKQCCSKASPKRLVFNWFLNSFTLSISSKYLFSVSFQLASLDFNSIVNKEFCSFKSLIASLFSNLYLFSKLFFSLSKALYLLIHWAISSLCWSSNLSFRSSTCSETLLCWIWLNNSL